MKLNRQIIGGVCFAAALIMLMGCATIPKDRIVTGTTNFNKDLEKAQNEMLLLNIVRSKMRHPLYFTAMTSIQGSSTASYTAGIGSMTIPFANFGKGSFGPTATGAYSVTPIMNLAPLNNKEFVQGILNDVSPETFAHFWQHGWPKEMLMLLLIDRIETKNPDKTYHNYPGTKEDQEDLKLFQTEIGNIVNTCSFTVSREVPALINGPEIDSDASASDLGNLLKIRQAGMGLKLDAKTGKYQLLAPPESNDEFVCKVIPGKVTEKELSEKNLLPTYKFVSQSYVPKPGEGVIYLRNPEGIFFYLGEIMRAGYPIDTSDIYFEPAEKHVRYCTTELFNAHEKNGKEDAHPFVEVDYEGVTYVIPRTNVEQPCPKSRSMDVLSILSLIIAQQQSAIALPPTIPVVTTIGK